MSLSGSRGDDADTGNFSAGITVNTVSELVGGSGVTVDGVLVKDGGVTASAGFLCDVISEVTTGAGVYVDGAWFKDGSGTFGGAGVITDDLTEKTTSSGITCNSNLAVVASKTLSVDTISEKTAAAGVTIDGALIKDGAFNGPVKHSYYAFTSFSGTQSLNNVTTTKITLNTADEDPLSMADTSTNYTITVPVAGIWLIVGTVEFASGSGTRSVSLYVGGTNNVYQYQLFDGSRSEITSVQSVGVLALSASAVIDLRAYQASGGSLNVTSAKLRAVLLSLT